jgi:hypothetical protein
MCHGNDESAGKRRSGKTRRGSPWLRQALVEAAQAAGRTKDTYLAVQYQRLATRRGKKKGVVAVGPSILVNVYYLLARGGDYQDLGCAYFDERNRAAVQRRLVRRLEALGYGVQDYAVQLQPVASPTLLSGREVSLQTRLEPMTVLWTAVDLNDHGVTPSGGVTPADRGRSRDR